MPWLAVAMLAGIGLWFALPGPGDWLIALGLCGFVAGGALIWREGDDAPLLRGAVIGVALMVAAGLSLIWARSALLGTTPISGPRVAVVAAHVLEREEQPARERARLIVATRDPRDGRAIRARLNVPDKFDAPFLQPGMQCRAKARLAPPQRAAVPGGYDFARSARFDGLAASGSLLERPRTSGMTDDTGNGASWRTRLARHIREKAGAFGGDASAAIAATLVTGDRGALAHDDAQAMRDAGLAHMLSISGMHVGAVIAICWFLVMKLGGLWPWLALRVRLPLVAASGGALAGIGYTLLTGAALPTIRACIAALLVLGAMALGRQALSLRLIALAAIAVMLFWPEAAVGASFQLSFAAVVAIVALLDSDFGRELAKRRGTTRWQRWRHALLILLLTGIVVEATLSPLVLYHFQRSGIFGWMANLVAIPLMTVVILPALIAALVADLIGLGAPFWWLAARSLDLIVGLAHGVSGLPGAILQLPQLRLWAILSCVGGAFWLALWRGRLRLFGLSAVAVGTLGIAMARPADLLILADGRNAALSAGDRLYLLRDSSSFGTEAMIEAAGMEAGDPAIMTFPDWPGANCNASFCEVQAEGRTILAARRRFSGDYAALARACARADIVIAQQRLPADCRPALLKADASLLSRRGGMAVNLESGNIRAVREAGDQHGW